MPVYPPNPPEDGLAPAPSRLPATENGYLRRALWFEGYAARMMGTGDVSPRETVACAIERKSAWSASTWRQTKAALIFRYAAMNTPDSRSAVEMLRAEDQSGSLRATNKTSGQRSKNISQKDMQQVLAGVRKSRSIYAPVLEAWLLLGAVFGLRPHEWTQSEVVMLSQADIEGKGDAAVKRPHLRVENAKGTNGRSHGKYRHLSLGRVSPAVIASAGEFTVLMALVQSGGEYAKYYAGCQTLLSRINAKLSHPTGKHVQLYSPRHQFAANAKKELSLREVGCLMGHSTDRTASLHYGKRQYAAGGLGVRPLASEVGRVKVKKAVLPAFLSARNKRSSARKRPAPSPDG